MATPNMDNPKRLTTNPDYFPAFRDIPADHEYYDRNFPEIGDSWCLIGEITQAKTFLRPRLVVRDRIGTKFVVALYLDRDVASRILSKFKPGYTVAIVTALGHSFLDGSAGCTIDDEEVITIFPCKLDEFIKLNDDADKHNWFNGKTPKCHGCGKEQEKEKTMICNGCKLVAYCSKECQVEGWNKGHNKQCKVMRDPDVKYLFQLDWSIPETGFGFGPNGWKGRTMTPAEKEALKAYNK